jgi:hypothetical protein
MSEPKSAAQAYQPASHGHGRSLGVAMVAACRLRARGSEGSDSTAGHGEGGGGAAGDVQGGGAAGSRCCPASPRTVSIFPASGSWLNRAAVRRVATLTATGHALTQLALRIRQSCRIQLFLLDLRP